MNCQIFETVVNDVAREQMMEANAREEALVHSDECESCALRLALERRLTSGLRALAAEMSFVSASARVEQQVFEAFRGQTSLLPHTKRGIRGRYWLAAAAAVVLIAFGIVAMKWGLDRSSPTRIEALNSDVLPSSKASTIAVEGSSAEPSKQTPILHRPRRKLSVQSVAKRSSGGNETSLANGERTDTTDVGSSAENEVTTQFLPLSYASPVNLQDGGQLVRVELPRSAMVRFGLPVNMERYGEKVKADVLVSADGLARAIRFVQ